MPALKFDLISPEKVLLSKQVAFVTMPGYDGSLGILEGHEPFIVMITPGVVEVYEKDTASVTDRFFVTGGFAEVTNDGCALLASDALPVAELDKAKLEEEEANLIEDMSLVDADDEDKYAAMEKQVDVIRAKIQAIK